MENNIMPSFVILHLSDIHIGNPKSEWDSIRVFDSLIEDIQKISKEFSLNPNLIIFSGDLAYGNIPTMSLKKQYELADKLLEKVFGVFQSRPKFLIVPGNHDLDRNLVDDAQRDYREKLDVNKVETMMVRNNITLQNYIKNQSDWKEFAKERFRQQNFLFNEELNLVSGVIEYQGTKIGMAGLNSAWLSWGDDNGKLWIGKNQIERALENIKDTEFKIAVFHHPYSWLNKDESNRIKEILQSNFNIIFHGHEHSTWFEDQDDHLLISAGACYERSDKPTGYNWLKLDFIKREAEIYLREYTDKGKGGWRASVIPNKTDGEGRKIIKHLFNSATSQIAEKKVFSNDVQHSLLELGKKKSRSVNEIEKISKSIDTYINQLDTKFQFIWEPPVSSIEKAVIFWAVRLRTPTPIHVVQSFIAADLQKRGCEIVLYLDDLGKTDCSTTVFFAKVEKWFSSMGGNKNLLVKRKTTDFITSSEKCLRIWSFLQRWMGTNTTYYVDKILQVSKLVGTDDSAVSQLSKKKARRLLTPAIIWAGLEEVFNDRPNQIVITLGGYDEKPLWRAWKECIKENAIITGHLYTPIMCDGYGNPLDMDNIDIGWSSRIDIRSAITKEIDKKDWSNEYCMIPWCLRLLSHLPRYILRMQPYFTIDNKEIESINELINLSGDKKKLINSLSNEFAHWILE